MRAFRFVHIGVAAAIAAAAVTGIGVIQSARAVSTEASSLVTIVPCRLADTRPGADQVGPRGTPLAAGETVTFAVRGANGNCVIPAGATGIVANVAVVQPTASSFLTLFPGDVARPLTANLNWTPTSPPTPNQVTVALSSDGAVAAYNLADSVHLVIDVFGYHVPSSAGVPGPPGPAGPAGASGPTGPSGVVNVLDFDKTWHPATLPGNNGNTIITPSNCRTASHTASAGEVAVATFHGTATPSNPATDVLYINVMMSKNGGTFLAQTATDSAESMSDGTANASVSKRISLTAGATYSFGAGFSANGQVAISTGYCEGTVLIVKQ